MANDEGVGYRNPPKQCRWRKGQSGNPSGRPRSRDDLLKDAAAILTMPVDARTPGGRLVKLDAIEAAYLALCRKGLAGQKTSLLEAIRIMLDIGHAAQGEKSREQDARRELRDLMVKLRLPIDGLGLEEDE